MHRLNCKSHNLIITLPFQSTIRAAVIDTDEQGGEVAANALDDLLQTQPHDVKEACLNLGYSLLTPTAVRS